VVTVLQGTLRLGAYHHVRLSQSERSRRR
jgi:hypothetical protein